MYEPPSRHTISPSCSIYVHDPGPRYNAQPMSMKGQRWSDTDHNWHVAYWLHQALLNYEHRVDDPSKADAIFVAHYFLTANPVQRPLDFGGPLLSWDQDLKRGGAEARALHFSLPFTLLGVLSLVLLSHNGRSSSTETLSCFGDGRRSPRTS